MTSLRTAVRRRSRGRAGALLTCSAVLVLAIAGAAIAQQAGGSGADQAGDRGAALTLGERNGTRANPVRGQTELFASNGQYALRESNLSDAGGGAIHGCRTQPPPANAADPGDKPCLRANNLSSGQAFQFQTTQGSVGGRIQVGGTHVGRVNPNGVPFETNAAGLVANLNADRVDGLDAAQLRGQTAPPGPPGPKGDTGPQGPSGSANVTVRTVTVNPGQWQELALFVVSEIMESGFFEISDQDVAPGKGIQVFVRNPVNRHLALPFTFMQPRTPASEDLEYERMGFAVIPGGLQLYYQRWDGGPPESAPSSPLQVTYVISDPAP